MNIEVSDTLTPYLAQLRTLVSGNAIDNAMGQGAANTVRAHLVARNALPNQLGGRRTNFYNRAAQSVNVQVTQPGTATVSINKVGLRQRWQGGFIRPTGGRKYLTIPAIPEAHGRRASEFSNLRFGFTEGRSGGLVPALVEASASKVTFGRKRKNGSRSVSSSATGGKAYFFLVKQVFQQADPSVLPTSEQIGAGAAEGARNLLAAAIAKGGKG